MFNHKKTLTEAAKLAGVSQASLSRALKQPDEAGFVSASLPLRRKFMKLTQGKVTLMDWPEPLEDCERVGDASRNNRARGLPAGRGATAPSGARAAQPEGASLQGAGS